MELGVLRKRETGIRVLSRVTGRSRNTVRCYVRGDAKLYAFLKAVLPERLFQKLQIRTMQQPLSTPEIAFAKWLFGSNLAKLETGKPKQ